MHLNDISERDERPEAKAEGYIMSQWYKELHTATEKARWSVF